MRVVQGSLPPGSVLPSEAELSVRLKVSRTVVREALKVLAAKGLVDSRPKRGTRVLPRAHWSLIDDDVLSWRVNVGADIDFYRSVSDVRAIIEPRVAALAAERRADDELARMEALLVRMDGSLGDRRDYIAADLDLHAAILQATHNELLIQLTGTLAVAWRASRDVTTRVPGGMSAAIVTHRAVIDAIAERDVARAQEMMTELVDMAARDVELVFSREGAAAFAAQPPWDGQWLPALRPITAVTAVPPATGIDPAAGAAREATKQ